MNPRTKLTNVGIRAALLLGAIAAAALPGGCKDPMKGPLESGSNPNDVQVVGPSTVLVQFMTGSFSSHDQSLHDPSYLDIRLHITPIWPDRTDGAWFYVEQAVATSMGKPYRQRIYQVTRLHKDTFKSAVFELGGDPLAYAGAWKAPERLAKLRREQLVPRDGCDVALHDNADGTFSGSTLGSGCLSTRDGAAFATSEVTLTGDTMIVLDRGFNAAGEQVWGPKDGGYVFQRLNE